VIGRASKAASFLGGLATLVLAGAITADVLLRYFLNRPLLGVDEVAGFLQVLVVFWGCAYTFQQGGHIRVDLVTSHLPGPLRAWLRVVTLALGLLLLGVICWVTTQSALTAYHYQRVSAVMLYPLWPAMLLIPTGLALMAVAMLAALGRQLRAALGPRAGRDEVAPAGDAR
jgi:TRAP-type C4-dicarboxylate transport system permease small subunit